MPLDPSCAGLTSSPHELTYGVRDVILYALGIGAKADELDYLYEARGPRVYPTFGVCPVMPPVMACLDKTGGDFAMVVHGGQSIRAHRSIPAKGTMTTTANSLIQPGRITNAGNGFPASQSDTHRQK